MRDTAIGSHLEDARRFTHRRASVNVGNPAVILHRSYRKPFGENDTEWNRAIVKYVEAIVTRLPLLTASDDLPATPAKVVIYGDRHHVVSQKPGSARITVAVDVYDEFWTSKVIIDFSRADDGTMPKSLLPLLEGLSGIEDLIERRFNNSVVSPKSGEMVHRDGSHRRAKAREMDSAAPPEGESRRAKDEIDLSARNLTNEEVQVLCARISAEICRIEGALYPAEPVSVPRSKHDSISAEKEITCNCSDDLFADFVGFSLSCHIVTDDQKSFAMSEFVSGRAPREKEGTVFDNIQPKRKLPKNQVQLMHLVDALWPVAVGLNPYRTTDEKTAGQHVIERLSGEFAISTMNRNRALHVTSLGASSSSGQGRVYPLSYLILCPHRATWQIGRMIDRIHSLGVFRLASLFEHHDIDRANDAIRRLIDRLEADGNVRKIQEAFDDVRTFIDGGLHYRLEWSRYYLNIYESLLAGTTFGRVEGYQTYEEFVRRRIGTYFEAISSTSRRFAYLSRLLMEKTNQSTSLTSRRLLEFAEMFSFFPIAYYSKYVFEDINHVLVARFGVWSSLTTEAAWAIFVVLFGLIAARNLRGVYRDFRAPIRRYLRRRRLASGPAAPTRSPPSAAVAPPAPARRRARGRA